jgi:hypothetical protein
MKATGIVRRIDDLGRVVIPKNQKNDADLRGRPITDNIDRVGGFLFCNAGFLQTRSLGEYLKLGYIPSGVCPVFFARTFAG